MRTKTSALLKRIGACLIAQFLGGVIGGIISQLVEVRMTPDQRFWAWFAIIPLSLLSPLAELTYFLNSFVGVVRGKNLFSVECLVTLGIPPATIFLFALGVICSIRPLHFIICIAICVLAAVYMSYVLLNDVEFIIAT